MEEYDRIALCKEVFCRYCTTRTGGEVVDEAHSLVLERDSRSARSDKDDWTPIRSMAIDEFLSSGHLSDGGWWLWIVVKVDFLGGLGFCLVSSHIVIGSGNPSIGLRSLISCKYSTSW